MNSNLQVYNNFVHEYTDYTLTPTEINILHRFKDNWHNTSMLDIGVGTGRTTYTFSALVMEYHGIDYSSGMVERCKQALGNRANTEITVQDATNLSKFYGRDFDFVMFSLNGIDSVEHEERIQILSEISKVISREGYFFFSTHSLYSLPFSPKLPKLNFKRPLSSLYYWLKALKRLLRTKFHYRNVDTEAVLRNDKYTLVTGDHDFQMAIYHIKPAHQVTQLEDLGFEICTVYSQQGEVVDPKSYTGSGYLNFLCRPRQMVS
jgi:ubiquinone/menaquinone biosynthesis C-methylase UbiE